MAGLASLAFGLLAAVSLGSYLGTQVAAASASTVAMITLWGTAVRSLGTMVLIGGAPAGLVAMAFGVVALVRNGRIGKGCGLAGFLLGGVALVWIAIAVAPQFDILV